MAQGASAAAASTPATQTKTVTMRGGKWKAVRLQLHPEGDAMNQNPYALWKMSVSFIHSRPCVCLNDGVQDRRGGMTRPQSHTQPFSCTVTLHCGISYLFFAFILETQTRRSLLEALAIVCPGLVRLELHCGGFCLASFFFFFFFKQKPAKKKKNQQHRGENNNKKEVVEEEEEGGPKELTAEPPHRCCSLHPWSEMVGNQRRRGCWRDPNGSRQVCPGFMFSPWKKNLQSRLGRRGGEKTQVKAPADARDFQSAVSVQPRRHRSYVDYSLHSTALLWTHLRMAADSVQWTGRLEV